MTRALPILLLAALGWLAPGAIGASEALPEGLPERVCAVMGCDPLLLRAMSKVESEHDPQQVGDGFRSFGRFQIQMPTAVCYLFGRRRDKGHWGECVKRIPLAAYVRIVEGLGNDAFATGLAAIILSDCARRNRTKQHQLMCWQKGDDRAAYAARVLDVYAGMKAETKAKGSKLDTR